MKANAFKLLLLAVPLLLAACGGEKQQPPEQPAATTTATPKYDAVLGRSFYKRLEGTIADQPVVVQLHCFNGNISGIYYYLNHGIWLILGGKLDTANPNKISLHETAWSDGSKVATLDCTYEQGAFKGSWRSADGSKSYLIDLKEAYPEGSYTFTTMQLEDSLAAFPGKKESPRASISAGFVIPLQQNADGEWLTQQIRKAMNIDTGLYSLDLPAAVGKMNGKYLKSYRDEVKGVSAEGSAFLNYEDYQSLSVCYNEHGYLILNSDIYSYSGGAHGNGGSTFYCLDVPGRKRMELTDVLQADSAKLQPIVEAAFRRQQGLKPSDSLNAILFENHLATTRNFYFTNKGIGFYYFPYEVAAYAVGPIQVFVPFSSLKPYLKADFAQRMKL